MERIFLDRLEDAVLNEPNDTKRNFFGRKTLGFLFSCYDRVESGVSEGAYNGNLGQRS